MSGSKARDGGSVLVGDVGGTHSRYAIVDTSATPWRVHDKLDLEAQFPDFAASVRAYLDRAGLKKTPDAAAIAVAGPVTKGTVTFTNRGWRASEQDLKALGFSHALLINDFAALAFAVLGLEPADCVTIGPPLPGIDGEPFSIVGAGTGFGASMLARFRGRAIAVATEGGHMGFAPGTAEEIAVLQILSRRFDHVSVERVLSGPGLENLHSAFCEIAGRKSEKLSAAQIVEKAEAGDEICAKALRTFCNVYGSVAGDFALAHGARGGVYLAGGIALKIEAAIEKSDFRSRFEAKGRLSHFVKPIPTRLIRKEDTAFLGAARASLEFRDQ